MMLIGIMRKNALFSFGKVILMFIICEMPTKLEILVYIRRVFSLVISMKGKELTYE